MLRPPPSSETENVPTAHRPLPIATNREAPSGRLAAVTCHFNPCGYRRLRENFFRFREALRGCPLFTMEVSFDGQFHLPADWQVRATEKNVMWQKESLINEMVKRLPDRFDQVAWIDADLLFLNPDWAAETSGILREVPVAQLYENWLHTSANWNVAQRSEPSLLRKRREGLQGHGQPGGAWSARRELIEAHGVFPWNIVGGGDTNFSDALFGQFNGPITQISSSGLNQLFRAWGQRFYLDVGGRVGCTSGDIVHLFHGTIQNRRYIERAAILREAQFDPREDVRIGPDGLLEWASHKPELHRRLRDYFLARREDE